jgi:shikimate dehydrogenase
MRKAPVPKRKHVVEKDPLRPRASVGERIKKPLPREIGGYEGRPEPTRYGDWEKKGRCIDF